MLTTIEVTQKHIDDGKPKRCRFCPIALGIADVIYAGVLIPVSYVSADFYPARVEGIASRRLPVVAQKFIGMFDDGARCDPFSFQLDIPDQYLKGAAL